MRRCLLLAFCLVAALGGPVQAGERLAATETVRSCPRHGPGFVEVPGTGTCIRIGGRVRSEYGTTTRRVSRDDIAGFTNSGRISVDTRADTPYGPLRTFVRMRAGQDIPGGR